MTDTDLPSSEQPDKRKRKRNRAKEAASSKIYREKNHAALIRRERAYHAANREKRNQYSREYYAKHKLRLLALCGEWRKENADAWREYHRGYCSSRRIGEDTYRISNNLRVRLVHAINKSSKRGSAVRDLGCTIDDFRSYIETLFKPGMTWENWGRTGWHLDHIKPLTAFDLTDRAQFLEACHWSNYQPLWHGENIRKGGAK